MEIINGKVIKITPKDIGSDGLLLIGLDNESAITEISAEAAKDLDIETLVLLPTIKQIKYSAFANCQKLKTVFLPNGLNYIGEAGKRLLLR